MSLKCFVFGALQDISDPGMLDCWPSWKRWPPGRPACSAGNGQSPGAGRWSWPRESERLLSSVRQPGPGGEPLGVRLAHRLPQAQDLIRTVMTDQRIAEQGGEDRVDVFVQQALQGRLLDVDDAADEALDR